LKKGDEILVFGARNEDENFMAKTYFKEYTSRRVAKGIRMRMIFRSRILFIVIIFNFSESYDQI